MGDNSKWMKSHHLLAHEKPGIWEFLFLLGVQKLSRNP